MLLPLIASAAAHRRLILWPQSAPDAAYIAANPERIDALPVDGIVMYGKSFSGVTLSTTPLPAAVSTFVSVTALTAPAFARPDPAAAAVDDGRPGPDPSPSPSPCRARGDGAARPRRFVANGARGGLMVPNACESVSASS